MLPLVSLFLRFCLFFSHCISLTLLLTRSLISIHAHIRYVLRRVCSHARILLCANASMLLRRYFRSVLLRFLVSCLVMCLCLDLCSCLCCFCIRTCFSSLSPLSRRTMSRSVYRYTLCDLALVSFLRRPVSIFCIAFSHGSCVLLLIMVPLST